MDTASRTGILLGDPHFQTLLIIPDGTLPPLTRAFEVRCVARGAGAWSIFATIAGVASQAFSSTQLLADRNGWLRTCGASGTTWSDADFLCTSVVRGTARSISGLDALITCMNTESVRYVKGGLIY